MTNKRVTYRMMKQLKKDSSTKEKDVLMIGQTPRNAVWKRNKTILWHYAPVQKKYETPLFLIYSLINKPYILDLSSGSSMIETFISQGYDVYLLDFGVPGYEDKDLTLDDYIINYIGNGVRQALRHSMAKNISIIGYCLGGTLATIYAAIAKEPIKNLILFATPVDFSESPVLKNWHLTLKNGELNIDNLIDNYGIIPANIMESGMKLLTSPFSFSSYLSLLNRADDKQYVDKWQRFNHWVGDHVPFVGATLKQLIYDLGRDNKLIKNKLIIGKKQVNLSNIHANLLVISTVDDHIVPEELSKPLMKMVSSKDKTYNHLKGGHVSLALKGELPDFLTRWLKKRS